MGYVLPAKPNQKIFVKDLFEAEFFFRRLGFQKALVWPFLLKYSVPSYIHFPFKTEKETSSHNFHYTFFYFFKK